MPIPSDLLRSFSEPLLPNFKVRGLLPKQFTAEKVTDAQPESSNQKLLRELERTLNPEPYTLNPEP